MFRVGGGPLSSSGSRGASARGSTNGRAGRLKKGHRRKEKMAGPFLSLFCALFE